MDFKEWIEKQTKNVPNKQPFKTYDKAKRLAEERLKIFHDGMKKAAMGNKVITDIKSEGSFKDKTAVRGKEPEKVYDVLRGAIIVDTDDQVEKVVKNLKKIFVAKKVDHKERPDRPFGYYGAVHVDVVIHEMICEIQVMTKKLWTYKDKAHTIYSKLRSMDKPPEHLVKKIKKIYKQGNGDLSQLYQGDEMTFLEITKKAAKEAFFGYFAPIVFLVNLFRRKRS